MIDSWSHFLYQTKEKWIGYGRSSVGMDVLIEPMEETSMAAIACILFGLLLLVIFILLVSVRKYEKSSSVSILTKSTLREKLEMMDRMEKLIQKEKEKEKKKPKKEKINQDKDTSSQKKGNKNKKEETIIKKRQSPRLKKRNVLLSDEDLLGKKEGNPVKSKSAIGSRKKK